LLGCGGETKSTGTTGSGGSGGGSETGGGPLALDVGPRDFPCLPGQLELGDGTCQDAGIPPDHCPAGFEPDGLDGCAPILPSEPCDPGMMALPGETTCRPVAPCGSEPFAGIPVDATTVYVDQSFVGTSDGSASAPYKGLTAGIAAAAPGAIIAIAPGEYGAKIILDKPVKLWGKCPAEVDLSGGVYVRAGADATEIHRLSVSPAGDLGILVENASDVLVDETWVHDTGWMGLYVGAPNLNLAASLKVTRSLVERATTNGIFGNGQVLEVSDTEVRDTQPHTSGEGHGINGFWEPAVGDEGAVVVVERSLVRGAYRSGIRIRGGELTVTDTAVMDVLVETDSGESGQGIAAFGVAGQATTTTLDGVTVLGAATAGVSSVDGDLHASRLTVRNVVPSTLGAGVGVFVTTETNLSVATTLEELSVSDATLFGVGVGAADAALSGIAIRDIVSDPAFPSSGMGVTVEANAAGVTGSTVLEGLVVERARGAGLSITTRDVTASSLFIEDIRPDDQGTFGRGILVQLLTHVDGTPAAQASIEHCAIADVHEIGVAALGAELTLDSCTITSVTAPPAPSANGNPLAVGVIIQRFLDYPADATGDLRHLAISDTGFGGLVVFGSEATLTASEILADGSSSLGFGIAASLLFKLDPGAHQLYPSTVAVTGSRIFGSPHVGVGVFASEATLEDSEILCNEIHLNGEENQSLPFTVSDAGGNWCGCGDVPEDCKVLSSSLAPPSPVDEAP
ncbi:MAG: DUF1565 domain-containing protein, partial [Polyangiaceae bacterium]